MAPDKIDKLDEKTSLLKALPFAFQHLVLIFGSYLTPVIVVRASGLPQEQAGYALFVALIAGTIASIVQIKKAGCIGSGYFLLMCCSGAFIPVNIAAASIGGMALVATMTLLSSPVELFCAWALGSIKRLISHALAGTIVILVAIMLIPVGMSLWRGFPGTPGFSSWQNILTGLITLFSTLLCFMTPGKTRLYSPILGIVTGCAAAAMLGLMDISAVSNYPLIGLPEGNWPGLVIPQLRHLPIFGAFLLATLASSIETFGDSVAIQRISHEDKDRDIDYCSIRGALLADAMGSTLSGLMGGVANTTASGNIAAVEITGVASKQVGIITCFMMGTLAFSPRFAGMILAIPSPVLGGITVILAASLISTGLSILHSSPMTYHDRLTVGFALTVGIISASGMFFPQITPEYLKPFTNNAIATGGITAFSMALSPRFKPETN